MKDRTIEIKTNFTLLEDGTLDFIFPYDGPFKTLEELQKDRITSQTKLLYFVYRDRNGLHSGWVWCKEEKDLFSFLLNNLIARAISLEYGVSKSDKEGFRQILGKVAKTLLKTDSKKSDFPQDLLTILASSFVLENEATKDFSFQEKMAPLQETMAKFFYFVSFEMLEGFEKALEEVKRHKSLVKRASLRMNLLSDTSISDEI